MGWCGLGALDGSELEEFVASWRRVLFENDMLGQSWPTDYGGAGLSPLELVIVAEEFANAGVPQGGPNDSFSIQMVGNTILAWGTEAQKRHFLPRILSGEDVWCQGYSEPNAGSDLASLSTRAVLDGGEWILNGQKVWTSAGHLANWIFVLARTDPDARKHHGISFMLVPMEQAGIEVRQIGMMGRGHSHFSEVFFTDARCPAENVVGGVNNGWAVAMTLLGYERGEAAATLPIRFRGELDRLVELATETGAASRATIRQRIAHCHSQVEIMRYLGMRTLTKFLNGSEPGPDSSIFKLYWSEYHRNVTELGLDVLGAEALAPQGRLPSGLMAQVEDPGAPNSSASWTDIFLMSRAETIYAGTSEIQRNIIGEMVLGLPKEPRPA